MKLAPRNREQGSVLVISIITCLVIATVLASYLALISTRYRLTVRSMGWNAAIPILEAGIEEALTHLHDDALPTANGWNADVLAGQPVHKKLRNFSDGSYFDATIYNAASTNPIIYSTGYVPAPLGQGYIRRTVRVTATKAITTFPAGISANGKVILNSGIFDSYSSCLGLYSTNSNGLGTNGTIATNSELVPAVVLGSAKVYGTVDTGALGTVSYTSGSVGDKDFNATHSGAIQSGWRDNDMNVAFPTNPPPPGPFLSIPSPTAQGGSNVIFLGSGTFRSTTTLVVNANTNTPSLVVNGNAILYLKASTAISVQVGGFIKINPGASLTMYVEGTTATINGGGIINGNGNPANFSYIGLPGNTTFALSGTSAFYGTINAPQAALAVSGSSTAIYGAAIVKTYTGNTAAGFHYDECLAVTSGLLTITSWVEL